YGGWGNGFRTFTAPDRTPEETARMVTRHREQLRELLGNYGKIDMLCLDMWLAEDVWPEIRETVKMMRRLQSDVMIRARGIGNYGDYYTPENFVPESRENTNMPWMVIYPLADYWCYFSDSTKYKTTEWVVHNLVDAVAKGGSFMVGIGPDKTGRFHPTVIERLEAVGQWLKVNGEGIYETRIRDVWKSGDIRFTRSKDNKRVYAFVETFPDRELIIPSVTPKKRSKVRLLGYSKPLKWSSTFDGGVRIEIPAALQSPENRPCKYAWTFKFEVE
ncbi:MAG: alpha-L-fucosidase, partial [Prevotellaceae bacterium]|nr:alpha-L-fucosidase [Prevotellaceae bacterium]